MNLRLSRLYSLIIMSLVITGAVGSYLLPINMGGFQLFFFRAEVIVLAILLFLTQKRLTCWKEVRPIRFMLILLIVWVIYAFFCMLLSRNLFISLKSWIALLWGVLIFTVLAELFYRAKAQVWSALGYGSLIISFLCIAIGFYEIRTLHHLPSSYTLTNEEYVLQIPTPIVFFGNPNGYAYFMALTTPILLFLAVKAKYRVSQYLVFVCMVAFGIQLYYTQARLSLFVWSLEIFSFSAYLILRTRSWLFLVSACLLTGMGICLLPPEQINSYFSVNSGEFKSAAGSRSTTVRVNHVKNAIFYTGQSYGFGLGPGNYEAIPTSKHPYWISGIGNPHNLFVEIAVDYGLYICVGFFILLISTLWYFDYGHQETLFFCMLLFSFILLSPQNSGYLKEQSTWIFLSIILFSCVSTESPAREKGES